MKILLVILLVFSVQLSAYAQATQELLSTEEVSTLLEEVHDHFSNLGYKISGVQKFLDVVHPQKYHFTFRQEGSYGSCVQSVSLEIINGATEIIYHGIIDCR